MPSFSTNFRSLQLKLYAFPYFPAKFRFLNQYWQASMIVHYSLTSLTQDTSFNVIISGTVPGNCSIRAGLSSAYKFTLQPWSALVSWIHALQDKEQSLPYLNPFQTLTWTKSQWMDLTTIYVMQSGEIKSSQVKLYYSIPGNYITWEHDIQTKILHKNNPRKKIQWRKAKKNND